MAMDRREMLAVLAAGGIVGAKLAEGQTVYPPGTPGSVKIVRWEIQKIGQTNHADDKGYDFVQHTHLWKSNNTELDVLVTGTQRNTATGVEWDADLAFEGLATLGPGNTPKHMHYKGDWGAQLNSTHRSVQYTMTTDYVSGKTVVIGPRPDRERFNTPIDPLAAQLDQWMKMFTSDQWTTYFITGK